jgi:phospholipid/cholesterol/gamma-HCH transport system permease protein
MRGFLQLLGNRFMKAVIYFDGSTRMLARTIAVIATPPFRFSLVVDQIEYIGMKSTLIATFTALFTGLVMALQLAFSLERFGAQSFAANVLAVSLVRELGPVLTGLLVGGRVGAGITAEVGSMKVTEQIDAIRALGADPIRELVAPKLLACTIVLPVLTVYSIVVGILSGMLITMSELGVNPTYYMNQVYAVLEVSDFVGGVGKSAFFGVIIGLVGCYRGFTTAGGTVGVGRATTESVVTISLSILVADFFLTKLFILLFQA